MNLNHLATGARLRDRLPPLPEPFQMELDCRPNQPQYLFTALTRGHTARQIGDVRAPARRTFFHNNGVAHDTLLRPHPGTKNGNAEPSPVSTNFTFTA